MKSIKLSAEELESMSHGDIAYKILKENGKKMTIQDLFKEEIKIMGLPESTFESKIADFFGLLSTDKRFIMLEKGFWDLKENHVTKVIIDDDEEDEDELVVEEESEDDLMEDETEEEINYDETVDDDDDEDDLKDLVIMDENEENDMM